MKVENQQGTVIKKFDVFEKGNFKKLEFVVNVKSGEYDNPVKITAINDRVDFAEKLKEGDKVEFSAFVQGNEWEGKYFTNLNLAYVKVLEAETASVEDSGDSLPF
jgi:hypothetical protein